LFALVLVCACSSHSTGLVDGGTGLEQDTGPLGSGDGGGWLSGDGDEGMTGDGDACAWADARPVAKSPVVWLALDPSMLTGVFVGNDGAAGDETNADALRPVLFGANGIVSRMEHFVRFGLVAYGMTAAFSNCADGILIPAALNNASAIAAAYDASIMNRRLQASANWATLEAVETEIAKQNDSFRNTVLLLTQSGEGGLCPDHELGANSESRERDAVNALADKRSTVSVVTFLYPDNPEYNVPAIERNAALAKIGHGSAFAGSDGDKLIAAVERFVEEGASCEVSLEGKVKMGEECTGDVQLGNQKLVCNDPDGFKLTDASTLELTGKACDDLRSTSELTLHARFPCESFVLF